MVTIFRITLPTTYPMSLAPFVRGKSLFNNMGDTGLKPVTPCLSNEGKTFFTNFITA